MTARTDPPFRADHVGSLLRPKELQVARAAWKAGTMTRDALRAVEDRCITAAIAKRPPSGALSWVRLSCSIRGDEHLLRVDVTKTW